MQLFLKWLKPDVVPLPRQKNIPLGIQVQLFLYRHCLKTLSKWYQKYAFSDSIVLAGNPMLRVIHEYRDYTFETELKRLHIPYSGEMTDVIGVSSHFLEKKRKHRYYNCFCFEDHFLFEIDGKQISIEHKQGRSFASTIKGHLKESNSENIYAKYVFAGSLRANKIDMSCGRPSSEAPSSSITSSVRRTAPIANIAGFNPKITKVGGLFGDDPLLEGKQEVQEAATHIPSANIKNVEGVTIDESF